MTAQDLHAQGAAPNIAQGAAPRRAARSGALRGAIPAPGDKSISHRALMLGGLAIGETEIVGLLEGEDVLRTAAAMRRLGAEVNRGPDGVWRVYGIGLGGLLEPEDVLDMGNAGTGARLLMGLVAGHPIVCTFSGDASLRRRPMGRVIAPLVAFGAQFVGRSGDRLPLTVAGAVEPTPMTYRLPLASAQVKSAVLLCGLNAPGLTSVIEPDATRDHTERMLRHFGCAVEIEDAEGGRVSTVAGQQEMRGREVKVPGDPSSAAFPLVAALLRPDSETRIAAVGMNPHRTGLITTLLEMGADIRIENKREQAGEPVADIVARGSELRGVETPPDRAPSMIDEFPILAVAAACADGPTVMRGLSELRVKESDRLGAVAGGLTACGAKVALEGDDLTVFGAGKPPHGGVRIPTDLDHRIAMSFLVLGLATDRPVEIDDVRPVATSFPGFEDLMRSLGADIGAPEQAA